jgi:hypothetical protein
MTRIKAHYDGRVFVPDEPVQLPPGKPVSVDVEENGTSEVPTRPEDQLAKFRRLFVGSLDVPPLPDEALRRESIYRDDV